MAKTDSTAKAALRNWPPRTRGMWSPSTTPGYWLRAQPVDRGSAVGPRLRAPGTTAFKTQPDGLWTYMVPDKGYAEIVAIEACGTVTNLRDKRSRYSVLGTALLVACSRKWLQEEITVQRGAKKPRWEAADTFDDEPLEDVELPVRAIRVIFALPQNLFNLWRENGMGAAHEFYCPLNALSQRTSQRMQTLLKRSSPHANYYR